MYKRFVLSALVCSNVFCGMSVPCYSNDFSIDCSDDWEEDFNYSELGEYEEIYREFERHIDLEEQLYSASNFVYKWGKNLKKWFKKRIVLLCKKCLRIKKFKNTEEAAHYIAKFKRKLDGVHDTGTLDNMVAAYDKYIVKNDNMASFENFIERIKYYDENPSKYPHNGLGDRYDFHCERSKENELDNIPLRALVGGVEMFCGVLILRLPFPGCQWLGSFLIGHGADQIYEGYMQEHEKNK